MIGTVGGSGFIGMAPALQGHAVRLIDRASSCTCPAPSMAADVRDLPSLSSAVADTPIHPPHAIGLGCGVAGRLTGRRFSINAMGVRKYRANTQFADARCLATSFIPRHELHTALVAMIGHEFAPQPASAKTWAFAPSELGHEQ